MKNIELIKEIINRKNDVATRKVMKLCYPEVVFDEKDKPWQDTCQQLIKNAMYDLYVYNNFEQETLPDVDVMAKIIYDGANIILGLSSNYENESEQCKQHCRYVAQVALEYVLPAIHSETTQLLQSTSREKGFRGWIKAFIADIKDVFANAGG